MRLASKTMAQIAEPLLWRHVVLVPNSWCIKGFIHAVKASSVLQHVTTLTYDARFATFFDKIKSYRSDSRVEQPKDDPALVESVMDRAAHSCFVAGEDTIIEVAWLSKVIRMLPSLLEVTIRDCGSSRCTIDSDSIPHFYHKLCTMINVNPGKVAFNKMGTHLGRSYTRSMLMAIFTAGCPVKTIRSTAVDVSRTFAPHGVEKAATSHLICIDEDVAANLSTLELSFGLRSPDRSLSAIQFMLSAATRLKSLSLSLANDASENVFLGQDDMPSQIADIFKTRAGPRAFKPTFPNLENLALDGCVSHEEDLIHFLRIHSSTLRHLRLSNMALLVIHERHGCWVAIIKSMQKMLQLSSAIFNGWFNNGGRQHWFVTKDNMSPERLKAKIEKFIVDKRVRDCPLERVAIKLYENDVSAVVNTEEWEGDLSWTMVYNRIENDSDFSWELNTPVFSDPSLEVEIPVLPPSPPSLHLTNAKEQPQSLGDVAYNEQILHLYNKTALQTWLPDDDSSDSDLESYNADDPGFFTTYHGNKVSMSDVKGKATSNEWTIDDTFVNTDGPALSQPAWGTKPPASFAGSMSTIDQHSHTTGLLPIP